MNDIEIVFFAVAELVLFFYLLYEFRSWKIALVLALASAIPLYLSLERSTQFLTVDEIPITRETVWIDATVYGPPANWMLGALRTTDTFLGLLMVTIHKATIVAGVQRMNGLQNLAFIKALHWVTGFGLLLWMHHLLSRHFVSEANRGPYFLVFLYLTFLLPASNLALKVFNYDLLSMLLGIIAILYIIISVRLQNFRYALLSIVVSLLATQEKSTVFPILVLAFSIFAYLFSRSLRRRQYVSLLTGNVLAVLAAILISTLCTAVVAALRDWDVSSTFWWGILDPLVSWAWAFILSANNSNTAALRASTPLLLVVLALVSMLFSVGWSLLHTISTKRPALLQRAGDWLAKLNLALIAAVIIAGIVSTFFVDVYWYPHVPVRSGHYQPVVTFNRVAFNFGAKTFFQHLLLTEGFTSALIVNAIPSVLWLTVIGAVILQRSHAWERSGMEIELLIGVALLGMLGYALTLLPLSRRYIAIWLFLFVLAISLKVIEAASRLKPIQRYACSAVLAILLVAEVFPFRPLYAAFRPFWSHYDDSAVPIVGKLSPFWLGWGEGVMLAGQMIREQCQKNGNILDGVPCRDITLYSVYPGEWLEENTIIHQMPFWKLTSEKELSYTDADYYLVNRSTVVQGWIEFPAGVEPVFVISFRGYTQAWVFQGSELQDAGFEFRLLDSIGYW